MPNKKHNVTGKWWSIGFVVIAICLLIIGGIKIKGYSETRTLCKRIAAGENIDHTEAVNGLTAPAWLDEIAKILQVDGPKIPLVEACYYRNTSAVAKLLENGADPNFFIEGRKSPLEAAIMNGPAGPIDEKSCTIVQMLIEAGADVNKYASDKPVVIQLSSSMVLDPYNPIKEKALCLLLNHNVSRGYSGYDEVFHNIIRSGNVALSEKMIELYGADVNEVGYNDQTPLILAVSYSESSAKVEIVQMLLQYGADVTFRDATGKNALEWAIELDKQDIVEVLTKENIKS